MNNASVTQYTPSSVLTSFALLWCIWTASCLAQSIHRPYVGVEVVAEVPTTAQWLSLQQPRVRSASPKTVDVYGRNCIVGTPNAVQGPGYGGGVDFYLYVRGGWKFLQRLVPVIDTPVESFGHALALGKESAAIAATRNETLSSYDGVVFLYAIKEGAVLQTSLIMSEKSGEDFGSSVALNDGGYVVIGSPTRKHRPAVGRALVYSLQTGNLKQILLPHDCEGASSFGRAVTTSGSRVFVGSPYETERAIAGGKVYIYRYDAGGGLGLEQVIIPEQSQDFDLFGSCVQAISENELVITSLPYGIRSGAVFMFKLIDGVWRQVSCHRSGLADKDDLFGFALDCSEELVFVGAPCDYGKNMRPGTIYMYGRCGEGWGLINLLQSPLSFAGDRFGHALGVYGDDVIILANPAGPDRERRQGGIFFAECVK